MFDLVVSVADVSFLSPGGPSLFSRELEFEILVLGTILACTDAFTCSVNSVAF